MNTKNSLQTVSSRTTNNKDIISEVVNDGILKSVLTNSSVSGTDYYPLLVDNQGTLTYDETYAIDAGNFTVADNLTLTPTTSSISSTAYLVTQNSSNNKFNSNTTYNPYLNTSGKLYIRNACEVGGQLNATLATTLGTSNKVLVADGTSIVKSTLAPTIDSSGNTTINGTLTASLSSTIGTSNNIVVANGTSLVNSGTAPQVDNTGKVIINGNLSAHLSSSMGSSNYLVGSNSFEIVKSTSGPYLDSNAKLVSPSLVTFNAGIDSTLSSTLGSTNYLVCQNSNSIVRSTSAPSMDSSGNITFPKQVIISQGLASNPVLSVTNTNAFAGAGCTYIYKDVNAGTQAILKLEDTSTDNATVSTGTGILNIQCDKSDITGGTYSLGILDYPNATGTLTDNTKHRFFTFKIGGTIKGNIGYNASGNTAYTTTSDQRLKSDITPVDTETYYNLIRDNPELVKTYYYNNSTHNDCGCIAQEMDDIFPYAVTGDPNGDVNEEPMSIDYGKLSVLNLAVNTQVVKEVESLKRKYDEISADIVTIKNILNI